SILWIRPANGSSPWSWENSGTFTGSGSVTVSLMDGDYFTYVSVESNLVLISDIQFFSVSQYDDLTRWGNRRDASFNRSGLPLTYQQYTSGSTNPRTGRVVKQFNPV